MPIEPDTLASLPAVPEIGAVLDLQEELSPPARSCSCGPKWLRLLSDDGELVPLRGKRVNQCAYCAALQAVENSEMLALDACEGDAPSVWLVLTTRHDGVEQRRFYKAREHLIRAIRRRRPGAEYASLLEYTSGYAKRSGGRRRPHWNVLLKGVGEDDLGWLRELVDRIWCPAVDAQPSGQYVDVISEAGGLMRYISLHFQKESQTPPAGFSGQRFNCSRGYFTGATRATARARARDSLRFKRELWKAERAGLTGAEGEWTARRAMAQGHARIWVLANERGVRLSGTAVDARRMILGRDRQRGEDLRSRVRGVRPVAAPTGVAARSLNGQADRERKARRAAAAVRAARERGPVSLPTLQLWGVRREI